MENKKEDKEREGLRIKVLAKYAGSQIRVEEASRTSTEVALTGFKADASIIKISGFRDGVMLGDRKVESLDILVGHGEPAAIGFVFSIKMESGEVVRIEPRPGNINALFFKGPESPKATISGNIIYPWLFPD